MANDRKNRKAEKKSKVKHYNYKIRLLRKGYSMKDAFGPGFRSGSDREFEQRSWQGIERARLYIRQIYNNPPDWIEFVGKRSSDFPSNLYASGAGAVLFVPVDEETLAICFGQVHIALNDDAFVRQFGLITTLNAVSRENLRSLDTASLDVVTIQKRIQTSKDSDLQAFGIDTYRDLARVAAGTPKNPDFAKFVAGKDTLTITAKDDAGDMQKLCNRVLKMYKRKDYKEEFAWVDQMQVVQEKDIIAKLDGELFDALNRARKGETVDLHMSPPEIIDYVDGTPLHYKGFGKRIEYSTLSIYDYIDELKKHGRKDGINDIKEKHRVESKGDGEKTFGTKWKVYDCFVFETLLEKSGACENNSKSKKGQKHYFLFAGTWYYVNASFKAKVESKYQKIVSKGTKIIGPTKCLNEEDLTEHLSKTRDDLLMLGGKKINPEGVQYGFLEPCDFFSRDGEFIHLKDGHSSSTISHVWLQGFVSAEAFISDLDFRIKLRKQTKDASDDKACGFNFETLLPTASEAVNRKKYKVVYGIMRKPYKKTGKLGLPFFSKVSLQASVEQIEKLDLEVEIELIEKLPPKP